MTNERSLPLTRNSAGRSSGTGPRAICADCAVANRAVCSSLEAVDRHELGDIASTGVFATGQVVYSEGEAADAVFVITEGWAKTYKLLADGRRQITAFLMAGDLLGMDADGVYVNTAEALGPMRACRYARHRFDTLAHRFPRLEQKLLATALEEVAEGKEQMLSLGRKAARERLASFLLRLSAWRRAHGLPANPVGLPMTRADIADYLGLTTETVSRNFTALKEDGLVRLLPDNQIELVDETRLAGLAGGSA